VGAPIHHYTNGALVVNVDLKSESRKKGRKNIKLSKSKEVTRNLPRMMHAT
jgi:hypothetical protein